VIRTAHVAIDLGAESGRVVVGVLERGSGDNGVLRAHEVHRFEHRPTRLPSGLFWDIDALWREIVYGLRAGVRWSAAEGLGLVSVGVDAWGVDFALVDEGGEIVVPPHCYRDERHDAAMARTLAAIPEAEIFARTGVRTMSINSLYQLVARVGELGNAVIDRAASLLFIPDYFHFRLSGVRKNEASIASTSQMVDRSSGAWTGEMLGKLELPVQMLGEIVRPGTVLGAVRAEIAREIGLDAAAGAKFMVVVPGSHDTASAVAAVPAAAGTSWAYLSSGTWSLLGIELDRPCITEAARLGRFTNEVGVSGTTRFHKNIVGLWVVQECRRDFERLGQVFSYAELTGAAASARPFRTVLDLDHQPFLMPGEMLEKIRTFARETEQPEPRTPGEFVRCCLESLALSYRTTLGALERVAGRRIEVIHVVGGGGKNRLLNQMTADACARPVLVGPLEATAVGNGLVQAMGLGLVKDLAEVRRVVARSSAVERFEPEKTDRWGEAERRLAGLRGE